MHEKLGMQKKGKSMQEFLCMKKIIKKTFRR